MPASLKLVVVDGPARGKEFPLGEGETVMGRTNETPIELPSNKVSRRHAAIRVARGQVEIEDLGSSNGTYLNGKRISRSAVPAGAKIVVGEYVLQVVNGGAGRPAAAGPGGRPVSGKAMVVAQPGRQPRGPGRPGTGPQRGPARGRPTATTGAAASEGAKKVADQVVGKMGGIAWRTQVFIMAAVIGLAMLLAVAFLVARTKSDFRELALGRAQLVAQQLAAENATYLFLRNDLSLSGDSTAKQDGVKDTLIVAKRDSATGEVVGEISFPALLRGNVIDENGEYAVILEALKATNSFDVVTAPNPKNPEWIDIAAPMQYYDSNDPVNPGFKLVGVAFITFDANVVADRATSAALLYGVALVVLVLASAGGALLVIRATEPAVARLQEDTELMIRGDIKQVRSPIRMKELEALAHSINRLSQKAAQAPARSAAEDMAAGRVPASPALALPAQAGPVDNAGASATVRALVSAIEDAVIVVDQDNNVVEVNKPAERLFGLIPSRVRGKHLLEAIGDNADLLNTVLDVINEITAAPEGVVARDAQLPGGLSGRISAAGVRQGNDLAGAAIVFSAGGGGA